MHLNFMSIDPDLRSNFCLVLNRNLSVGNLMDDINLMLNSNVSLDNGSVLLLPNYILKTNEEKPYCSPWRIGGKTKEMYQIITKSSKM